MGCTQLSNKEAKGKYTKADAPLGYSASGAAASYEPQHASDQGPIAGNVAISVQKFPLDEAQFTATWSYATPSGFQQFANDASNQIEKAYLNGQLMFHGKAEGADFSIRFSEMALNWSQSEVSKVKRDEIRTDEFWWEVQPGQLRPFPPTVQDHLLEIDNESQFEFGTLRVKVNKNTMQMTNMNDGTMYKIQRSYEQQSSLF